MPIFKVRISGCQIPSNMEAPDQGNIWLLFYEIDRIEWLFKIRQVCKALSVEFFNKVVKRLPCRLWKFKSDVQPAEYVASLK